MHEWDIAALVGRTQRSHDEPYAAVLLNTPIPDAHIHTFQRIWSGANERICADGAANRLYGLGEQCALPTQICGDLDSIHTEVRAHYEAKGVPIVLRPSQYATDLQKGIQAVEDIEGSVERHLVLFGGLTGRLDQTVHTLHVLWQLAPHTPSDRGVPDPNDPRGGQLKKRSLTVSVSDNSVTVLLPAGDNRILHDRGMLGKTCGILPLGTSVHVSTAGLEWNLGASLLTDGALTSLGGFLSTSNHLAPGGDGTVELRTDAPVYWTVELKSDSDAR